MTALEIFQAIEEGGLKSAGIIFLLVGSYKLYRMQCSSESNCCPGFKLVASNPGGGEASIV